MKLTKQWLKEIIKEEIITERLKRFKVYVSGETEPLVLMGKDEKSVKHLAHQMIQNSSVKIRKVVKEEKLTKGSLNEWKQNFPGFSSKEYEIIQNWIDMGSLSQTIAMYRKNKKSFSQFVKDAAKEGMFEGKLNEKAKRDYKAEYKKYGSSTKAKKYRAELNKYNRQKGTYGNGDKKDASHKGGKIVGFEEQSKNRGRAEKSRLKKEVTEDWSSDKMAYSSKEAKNIMDNSLRNYAKQLRKVEYKIIKDWMTKAKAGVLDFFDIEKGLTTGDISRAHPEETRFLHDILTKDKILNRFRSYFGGKKGKPRGK